MVPGLRAAWSLLLVATLQAPLHAQTQPRPSSLEAQAAAAQWLHTLGPNGLVLEHRVPDPGPGNLDAAGRGFVARQDKSPYWSGKRTTLVLEEPGWTIRLGFNGELSARSARQTVQRLFGNGRISLRVRTHLFALAGQDPALISQLPADAAAPPSAFFQIRQSLPLDLSLEAPLQFRSDASRSEGSGEAQSGNTRVAAPLSLPIGPGTPLLEHR